MEKDVSEVLTNNYLLASLNIRIWSGKRTDRAASVELQTNKGAVSDAASVVVKLLAGHDKSLKETQGAYNAIRSFFYENSSPWTINDAGMRKGDRLISTAKSIEFLSKFEELKRNAEAQRDEFLDLYEDLVSKAASSMGSLYNPALYPTRVQIATMFDAQMFLRPVPAAADFDRVAVPPEMADGLKDLYVKQTQRQMDVALSDIQERLMDGLSRVTTQLGKVAAGEKTRLFKSLTNNMRHLVEMARSVNFTDNPKIESVASEIEQTILRYEVDMYRDNATLARNAAEAAAAIRNKVDGADWSVRVAQQATTEDDTTAQPPRVPVVTPPAPEPKKPEPFSADAIPDFDPNSSYF